MIAYEVHPIGPAEASKLKAWLSSHEADLFRDCLVAMKNKFFIDSINIKCRPSTTSEDKKKNETLAAAIEDSGRAAHQFISELEKLSGQETGFFRLKINT